MLQRTALILGFGILMSCEPPPWDRLPPRLLDTEVSSDGRELTLDFDEPVAEAVTGGNFTEKAPETSLEGSTVRVTLPENLKPGKGYRWEAEVKDSGNNLTSVTGRFYGPNDHPASLRLNEVRVAGSGNRTDLVELRVEVPGSLGGWTLEAYSTPEVRQRLIFPDVEVTRGQLVVVHYKPSGKPEEKDETADPAASGGLEVEPEAWDFWQPEGKGLPGTKGLLILRQNPDGVPVDGLLYSQRPGEAAGMAEAAGWSGRDELSPEGCTATRTWCRTDEPAPAWIITATGGTTPGKPNKLTAWAGPTSSRSTTPKTKGRRRRRHGVWSNRARPTALFPISRRAAVAGGKTPVPTKGNPEGQNGTPPPDPPRPGPPGPAPRHPGPRRRGPRDHGGCALPDAHREALPPTRDGRILWREPLENGSGGNPRREAATLFV